MAKTNLQRKSSYYNRVIKEGKNSRNSVKYQRICTALAALVEIADKLKEVDHQMSEAEYRALAAQYNLVQEKCRDFIKSDKFNDYEKEHKGIVEEIMSVVGKDIKALDRCDPKNPGTLSEIMEKSRSHTIVLKNVNTVGGALSSRIPLKTAGGKRGFFTPMSIYNKDKEWAECVEKHKTAFKDFPDEFKQRLEQLKTNGAVRESFAMICGRKILEGTEEEKNGRMEKLAKILGMENVSWKSGNIPSNEQKLYDALYDFAVDLQQLSNHHRIMKAAGIKANANISSRNCAMSDMARLLKCDHLLANSVHMKVVIDGREVEGVFMETAEGCDTKRLKEGDLIMQAKWDAFDNPEVMHQITDLQVLDYICGNTDRHTGNMVYQFRRSGSGKIILGGIKGIDNDCSFGTPDIKGRDQIMKLVKPGNMMYITKEMRSTLGKIKKPMLKTVLANDKLSDEEIDAAWDRLQDVVTAVNQKQIKEVKKDFWIKHRLNLMKGLKAKDNYFFSLQKVQAGCQENVYTERYREKLQAKEEQDIKYVKEEFSASSVMLDEQNLAKIRELRKNMNDAKAMFFNSSEYEMMKNNFEKVEKLTADILREYPKGSKDPIPEELTDQLRDAYIDLAENTYRYIELKKLVPFQTRGKKRLEVAKDLMSFANETFDKLGAEIDIEDRIQKADEAQETEMDEEMLGLN